MYIIGGFVPELPRKPIYPYILTLNRQKDLLRARKLTGQATNSKAIDEVFSTFFRLLSNLDNIPPSTLRKILGSKVVDNYLREQEVGRHG